MAAASPEPEELPPSTLPELSLDIILGEIIPKLAPKPYHRFKTVCRLFNDFISSPKFTHLNQCQFLSNNNPFLNIIDNVYCTLYTYDLDSLSSAPYATFHWPRGTHPIVVGSCNGLILVTHSFNPILAPILLNPLTRTYINTRLNRVHGYVPRPSEENLGFGFDDSSNDYKIVMVFDVANTANNNVITTRYTMVYSVNSMSWRVVDQTIPSDSSVGRKDGVLTNNRFLHWMFWSPAQRKRRIGCFDVCSENWIDNVLLPDYYYDASHKNYLLEVGVLDGCLSSSFENKVDSCYDVWVMKEHGHQASWSKLLSIDMSGDPLNHGGVVPISRHGSSSSQVLLKLRHKPELLWHKDNAITKASVSHNWELPPYVSHASFVSLPKARLFGDMFKPLYEYNSDV